jgi:hypothetical protein
MQAHLFFQVTMLENGHSMTTRYQSSRQRKKWIEMSNALIGK